MMPWWLWLLLGVDVGLIMGAFLMHWDIRKASIQERQP